MWLPPYKVSKKYLTLSSNENITKMIIIEEILIFNYFDWKNISYSKRIQQILKIFRSSFFKNLNFQFTKRYTCIKMLSSFVCQRRHYHLWHTEIDINVCRISYHKIKSGAHSIVLVLWIQGWRRVNIWNCLHCVV